jgi:polygalacturonase
MSGGVRNVTFRDSVLGGQRGIDIKPSVGRGGYIVDVTFQNVDAGSGGIHMAVGASLD